MKIPAIAVASFLALSAALASAQQIVLLTEAATLVTIDGSVPGAALSSVPITGLHAGEFVHGVDFRPATGQLYALGSQGYLYTVNTIDGVATQVGGMLTTTLSGTSFGFDFNPTVDRIRVVSNTGQNLRLNPVTGAVAAIDLSLAFAATDVNAGQTPQVSGSAYTNNVAGATTTTLYDIDGGLDVLVTQVPPNNGVLNTVGPLGIDVGSVNGFDISGATGIAYAALTSPGAQVNSSNLFTINLATGAATFVSNLGAVGQVRGLSVMPLPGVARFGAATLGCNGRVALGVNSKASIGNLGFALLAGNAAPNAAGLVVLSDAALNPPVSSGGVLLLVDMASAAAVTLPVTADVFGRAGLALAIPTDPSLVGLTRFLQVGFVDLCGPSGVATSNGISITIQP